MISRTSLTSNQLNEYLFRFLTGFNVIQLATNGDDWSRDRH